MKFKIIIIAILLFSWFTNLKAGELNVITTLPSLASITKSIGGDLVEVKSLTKGSQDAHFIEAKPSLMFILNKADLLIYSGLELEIGWLPLLIQGARNSKVAAGSRGSLNASDALSKTNILEKPKGEVDRTMGDVHPLGNPHFLIDPHNALLVAELIAHKLIELDIDNKDTYEKNLKVFCQNLKSKISMWENQFSFLKGKDIVCYHPHWSYLLEWMNLKNAGYIELRPGIPPTPRHKKEIIDIMKEKNIKVVVVSSWKEPTIANEVAGDVNARLLILPGEVEAMPKSKDYISWIDFLVTKMTSAYKNN
jgi:zinc/manganese transport system substrate-binding protein